MESPHGISVGPLSLLSNSLSPLPQPHQFKGLIMFCNKTQLQQDQVVRSGHLMERVGRHFRFLGLRIPQSLSIGCLGLTGVIGTKHLENHSYPSLVLRLRWLLSKPLCSLQVHSPFYCFLLILGWGIIVNSFWFVPWIVSWNCLSAIWSSGRPNYWLFITSFIFKGQNSAVSFCQ